MTTLSIVAYTCLLFGFCAMALTLNAIMQPSRGIGGAIRTILVLIWAFAFVVFAAASCIYFEAAQRVAVAQLMKGLNLPAAPAAPQTPAKPERNA